MKNLHYYKDYLMIKKVEPKNKQDFAVAALELNKKIHIIHPAKLIRYNLYVYLFGQAQIQAVISINICVTISDIYMNHKKVFLLNLVAQI